MYQFLALLTGVTLAVMVSINGNLAEQYGVFLAAAIIHLVGSLFGLIICALQKNKYQALLWGQKPKWLYLGGALGVFTTVFQNLAYGNISMTSIVALMLLGQVITSMVIDSLGLFGMNRHAVKKESMIGLVFALVGILMMTDATVATGIMAVCLSFGSGVTVVLSRTVNARLAQKVGALRGSLVNHLVGLPITIIIAIAVISVNPLASAMSGEFRPWIYFGGVLGVTVVLMCNLTVLRLSAFRLTLLTFVGQVFAGILLDIIAGVSFSDSSFIGGIVIALGITINMIIDKLIAIREQSSRKL